MRILAALTLGSLMLVPAAGQDTGLLRLPGPPPLDLPVWLAPVAENRNRTDRTTPEEAVSSYVTPALPPEVVAHYEATLRAAGISFETRPDENGAVIEANSGPYLGTVRIQRADGGARVDVLYARKPDPQPAAPVPRNVSGGWTFTHVNGRFTGTITLEQTGVTLRGTWHTATGKVEADSALAGRLERSTVYLTRTFGNLKQEYVLTVSSDGERIEGYGDGWGVRHGDLMLRRMGRAGSGPAAATISGSAPPRAQAPADAGPRAWYEVAPRKGEEWKWALQSVKSPGANPKYSTYYYEKATGRSVETLLALPEGGEIVHVFPVDCEFFIQDENGRRIRFKNAQEARGKRVGPGNWMVYPVNVNGVVVYMR